MSADSRLAEHTRATHLSPSVTVDALTRMLSEARARTLALTGDLSGEQLLGPCLAIVNPPLWEIGHLGWFQERWCLRLRADGTLGPSMLADADRLYDSAAVAHDTRWNLPLPDIDATGDYLARVLERVCDRLSQEHWEIDLAYFAQLAALHEEMHCEAFTYTRQTLGYRAPAREGAPADAPAAGAWTGDVYVPGGEFMLGASPDSGFVFDNEKWAHPIRVAAFAMARACVTNAEFAAFVDAGGYRRRELWSPEGWAWRSAAQATTPLYWQSHAGEWWERQFDKLAPLALHAPVMHVNWHEAQAYCRWAQRRLPSEVEWEFAAATGPECANRKRRYPWGASAPELNRANLYGTWNRRVDVAALPEGDSAWGCRQMIGNVWEWTADAFGPYPGFVADPYEEYSQPWFGDHKVLRGGAYATRACLIRNTWRNFYTPERRDVFAGFRTCAP